MSTSISKYSEILRSQARKLLGEAGEHTKNQKISGGGKTYNKNNFTTD